MDFNRRDSDVEPLITHITRNFSTQFGGRTYSTSSLDPYEDPATGLERISNSYTDLGSLNRRLRQQQSIRNNDPNQSTDEEEEEAISAKYESINYEMMDNKIYRNEESQPNYQTKLFWEQANRWFACFLIGIITAGVAIVVDLLIYYSGQIKFRFLINNLLNLCDQKNLQGGGCMWIVLMAWALYNCGLVFIASCLVIYLSPIAAGSGIPQIKCFLNGVQIPGVVKLKTLFVKVIGVACSVGGGLAAGKEGPMIHSGGVVAAGISQGRCKTFPFDFKIFEYFRNDREKRDFVSAGAAAGVAAAFGAPIGGVLFSLEEGASFWNQALTWRMVFTAMISSFTVNVVLSIFYGQSGALSWQGLANFGVFKDTSYNIWEIPFFLIIAVIGGIFGSLFVHLNVMLTKFRNRYLKSKFQKIAECLIVAGASAFCGFVTLFLVDDCQPIGVNPNLTEMTKLWCSKGKYSAVANLFFQNPEENVKSLFHSPVNSFKPLTLLIFSIEYYILTLWTYGLSVPSGIFIPCLLTGAAWGRLFGIGVEMLFPNLTGIDPGKYALAGAAAMLGGVVRMTISLTAIIVEATKDITFGLPIMLVLMITKWVGDFFNEGIYDAHIELNGIPILGWEPPKLSRNKLAEEIMRPDVVAVQKKEKVKRLLEILKTTSHHGFPVLNRIDPGLNRYDLPCYGNVEGLVLRTHIKIILAKKHFYKDYGCTVLTNGAEKINLKDLSDEYSHNRFDINKLKLSRREEECYVDFSDVMHSSPHRVPINASLETIFRLFRGLGLRYLLVVDKTNKLRGIITRKDVARFRDKRIKNKYSLHERRILT
ncbi:CBS domain and Chloride channel, voltage gated family and Chloride channel, core domain-containing protein [Strongyloides ratti]|uniref:Chloride channel protein n=1 Tax=Strongyloides ratti TaxID=34506 RepID=A0A090L4W2_STRRB|nr:CBS domain and Chloride channel, voltage gated family and Chloride channel, core domain-containing protein [Strongyloides ratti]CEF62539.1 CBS domain and Chloride channel, voltage gated family and Chloride channel, core domain-containing protein [Strongyloides ratti]